ncbi:hypothetical protein GQ54DRAFT_298878 [Martensiomyces pterosporus]|nr:hypothetical protein GQ54DRAFT_298878 [Martensiomyces pterosporus]
MFKKFWNEVGKRIWVSEYKESMLPRTTFRSPAPALQPEYKKPVTAASNLSGNQYFERDVRRNYPRTEVYTQPDVGRLLLGSTAVEKQAAAGAEGAESSVPSIEVKDVAEALDKLQKPLFSAENLPPVPGAVYRYKLSPEQTIEGPGEYYPSYRVY